MNITYQWNKKDICQTFSLPTTQLSTYGSYHIEMYISIAFKDIYYFTYIINA